MKNGKLVWGIGVLLVTVFSMAFSGCGVLMAAVSLVDNIESSRESKELFYIRTRLTHSFEAVAENSVQGFLLRFNVTYAEYEATIRGSYEKPSERVVYRTSNNTQNAAIRNDLSRLFKGDVTSWRKTDKTINEIYIPKNTRINLSVGSLKTIQVSSDGNGRLMFNNAIQREIENIITDITKDNNITRAESSIDSLKRSVIEIPSFARANVDLSSIGFVNEKMTLAKNQIEAQRVAAIAERQRQAAEGQRQEAERQRVLQQTKEQIMRMVRLDGTYINTRTQTVGHGGILPNQHVYAIRFCDKLLNREELDSIRAIVIYDTGREVVANFFECFLEGSNLYYADKNLSLLYTSTNNRNSLQARTASGNIVNFEFRPHYPVAGKTYRQFMDTRNSYTFARLNFTSQNIDRRLRYTYEYSEGVVTLKVQPPIENGDNITIINYLYIAGPFLTVGQFGPLYVEETMLEGW
jgi:hypothetical protein